ncbi:Fe(3+) dicitrate ABC transporter ATP-binding protein FecE, partial [Paenibacillus sp. MCAF20]
HHMIAIKSGKVAGEGSPVEVITPEIMREVFNIEADIVPDPRSGVPLCLPFALADQPTADKVMMGRSQPEIVMAAAGA